MQTPTSLLARLLKARYFPRVSFMDAQVGSLPSYSRHSILFGRDLLCKGVRWQIGDDTTFCIWHDPWVC